jgi:hypothetical protein
MPKEVQIVGIAVNSDIGDHSARRLRPRKLYPNTYDAAPWRAYMA